MGEIGSRLATIVAIGLRKTYAKSESDANRVMYIMMFIDLLHMWMLFYGSPVAESKYSFTG
jgi:hypothetical protein